MPKSKPPWPTVVRAVEKVAGRRTSLEGKLHMVVLVDRRPAMRPDLDVPAPRVEALQRLLKVFLRGAGYDKKWSYGTDRPENPGHIDTALTRLETTGSGGKRLLQAVRKVCSNFPSSAHHRILPVVTDESAPNLGELEAAIKAARSHCARVFVIGGGPIPLALPERAERRLLATQSMRDPNAQNRESFSSIPSLEVAAPGMVTGKSAGADPQRLRARDTANPLHREPAFDSEVGPGFGPWSVERLPRSTWGRCLFLHESKFRERDRYAPDLCSQKACEALR